MAMGQMSPHELEGLLEQEIEAIQNELLLPSRSLQRTAEALPGFGILAAVGGIIITMQSHRWFYCAHWLSRSRCPCRYIHWYFGCYCGLDPLSNAMAQRVKRNMTAFECVRATLVAYVAKSQHCSPSTLAVNTFS